ncbi:MAG: FKBP-type peptidyl-prolyl cis-trans isomerase [Candidatus Nanoarchaeia archaeon]
MAKKGDFIELDYTARLVDENVVFDTTEVEEAKKAGILHDHEEHDDHGHHHNHLHKEDLKPVTICIGERHVLPGLDNKLEGLELGKHKILLSEEEAFGKKDTKLLKLMPMNLFKKQNIKPFIGLTLDIDGSRGIVRSISGGRVIVDFNHPLSGKKVEYTVTLKRQVTDHKEQLEAVMKILRFPYKSLEVIERKAKIQTEVVLPNELKERVEKDLERVTSLKVEIISAEKKESAEKQAADKEKLIEKED